jgi:uncharacterized protein (TIGR04222 family)
MIVDSWRVVAGAAAIAGIVYAMGAVAGRPRRVRPATTKDPYVLAYISGGENRMVYAALAQLHASRTLDVTDDALIRVVAPLPRTAATVEREVYAAIAGEPVTRARLLAAARITIPSVRVRMPRRTALVPGLIMAVLALAFWVLTAQRLNGAGWHDGMGIVMGLLAILASLSAPRFFRLTPTKGDPLSVARSHRTGPVPDEPALSVALYGASAIWALDREFAWRADIPTPSEGEEEWSTDDSLDFD